MIFIIILISIGVIIALFKITNKPEVYKEPSQEELDLKADLAECLKDAQLDYFYRRHLFGETESAQESLDAADLEPKDILPENILFSDTELKTYIANGGSLFKMSKSDLKINQMFYSLAVELDELCISSKEGLDRLKKFHMYEYGLSEEDAKPENFLFTDKDLEDYKRVPEKISTEFNKDYGSDLDFSLNFENELYLGDELN